MVRTRHLLLLALASATLLLAACGTAATTTGGGAATTSTAAKVGSAASTPATITPATATATTAATASPATGVLRLTTADDGRTVDLVVGQRFLLALGSSLNWTVAVADPAVVSRVVNILVVRGAQGVYVAKSPGTTTLSATGEASCRQARPPCAIAARGFRVTLAVQATATPAP